MRIKFQKNKQKEFLNKVIQKLSAPSLRSILNYGINTNYQNLKNYYTERRTIPLNLLNELLHLSKIPKSHIKVKYLKPNWGQIKGGKTKKLKVV